MTCVLEQYVHHGDVYVLDNGAADTATPNTTILQALSLGLRVHTSNGVLSELPDHPRPKTVCQCVFEMYRVMLEGGAIS